MIEQFLVGLLPLALEYVPRILSAQESKDATLARRLMQEALARQTFEEQRIARSKKKAKKK